MSHFAMSDSCAGLESKYTHSSSETKFKLLSLPDPSLKQTRWVLQLITIPSLRYEIVKHEAWWVEKEGEK